MKRGKKSILISIVLVPVLLFTSCWNYQEIEKMAIVAGVAIDKNPQNGMYILTIEMINTAAVGGNSQVAISSNLYSAEGKTIFDAVRKVRIKVGEKIFWSHAKVLIISKEIAATGALPVVDWFERHSEPRPTMWMLISMEESAKKFLQYKGGRNPTVSFQIDDVMENQKVSNKFPKTEIRTFINEITSEDKGATVPAIRLDSINNQLSPQIEGTVIFKKDKMIGYLDGNETEAMLFIKDKIQRGTTIVPNVDGSDTNVALEIYKNKTKVTSSYEKENLMMDIDVKTEEAIEEISSNKDVIEEKNREKLKKQIEVQQKKLMVNVIEKVRREYATDVFGFGRRVEIDNPKLWKKIKSNWQDLFQILNFNINVEITITGSGKTSKPIAPIE